MVNRNERYWKNKEERAAAAKNHLAYVSEKYKEEISEQVVNTVMYDARVMQRSDKSGNPRQFFLSADTVTAIFTAKRSKDTGKVAALNFASFKNPGGMFLAGSKAQEECLCMDSTLYPVLNSFRGTYYEPNKKLLNRSLYTDRALYTPDVVFENEECTVKADIIRKKKTNTELNKVNHEARARGMSYGQYSSKAYAPVVEKRGRIV